MMDSITASVLSPAQAAQLLFSDANSSAEYDQVSRLVGQNISAELIEKGADAVKLELPSGQIINAKGDLPFPEHTQLQLKISVQDGVIRFQTLEALPPSPASILGPLLQSEAHALIQQLQELKLPEAMVPLAKLFDALIPKSEFQLQQAVEDLPLPTRQLLSSLLGLNNNDSTLLSRTLIEKFETITSLSETNLIVADKHSNSAYSTAEIDRKPNNDTNNISNDLRNLLSKYLESNLTNYTKISDISKTEQIDSLLKLIVSELLSDFASSHIDSAQSSLAGVDKLNQLEKILQTLKLLPDEIRNNLSDTALVRPDSDIGAFAKAVSNELRNSLSSNTTLPSASSEIEVIAKAISDEVRGSITNNIPDKANSDIEAIVKAIIRELRGSVSNTVGVNSDIEAIVKVISDKVRDTITNIVSDKVDPDTIPDTKSIAKVIPDGVQSHTSDRALAKADSDAVTIAKAMPDKASVSHKEEMAVTQENLPIEASKKNDRQKLIQILENLPVSTRKLVASVFLGSPETEPKAVAEYLTQKDNSSSSKQNFNSIKETPIPTLRQIISILPSDVRSSISDIFLSGDDFNIDTIAKSMFEKTDTNIKDKAPLVVSEENILNNTVERPNPQKLIQVLENISVPIRRAIASATMGTAEAEPKILAEFLIQKGTDSNNEQNLISKLETTSPLLRQIISLIAELKPDELSQQIIKTLLNGDKGVLAAAKGLLSLNENEDTAVTSVKSNFTTHARESADHSLLLATRLNYLLGFEMLNARALFSSQEKNSISSWFRSIVDQLIMAKTSMPEMPNIRQITAPQNTKTNISNTSTTPASVYEQAIRQDSTVIGEKPQTWQTWMRGSMEALTDPTISAKEAVFHTLAAKENINYFELPLPWMPGHTLEMWVEVDKENANRDKEKPTHRLLLALNFSALGETRVGLESIAKRLNIRVWAEHPQLIEKELQQMENELSALGFAAQISLHNLNVDQNGRIPTIKSIISPSSLHAMG